jgi:zinc D-Ala-D-Ala carboxypeptidase
MGDITKNISQHELKCQCGQCNVMIQDHEPVIQCVQKCCDYFATKHGVDRVTLKITSAARCYEHNREIGSNDNSQHPRCRAMDIQIFIRNYQVPPAEVAEYFDNQYPDSCGIGTYATFTHFDTRSVRARW